MVFEQMSPLIRQMDAGKMEIFGMNLNELKMGKGSLEVKIRINKNHDKEDLGK